jgi:hypothetical protein
MNDIIAAAARRRSMETKGARGGAVRAIVMLGAFLALGAGPASTVSASSLDDERCSAAEAVIGHVAAGGATVLGAPAPNLRGARDELVFQGWPGGPPPREILVGLSEEHPPSVLECPGTKRLARKMGLAIRPNDDTGDQASTFTAYASLPTLSSDRTSAASVVNTVMGGRGNTQLVTLIKHSGKWKVSGHIILSFS